jgi:hypothetical protein
MSGVAWAAITEILFGALQSVHRPTLVEMDVLASTFIQLVVCSAFMLLISFPRGAETVASLIVGAFASFTIAGAHPLRRLAVIAAGRRLEPITARVLVGSAFVVTGALVLIVEG